MRVFKDYKDYLENKKNGEKGVSQMFLDESYNGCLDMADFDNKTNANCFNCRGCSECFNSQGCVMSSHLNYQNNRFNMHPDYMTD